MQYVIALDAAIDFKCQAMTAVFIDKCQDLNRFAVLGPVHNKIIGPDMVAVGRT